MLNKDLLTVFKARTEHVLSCRPAVTIVAQTSQHNNYAVSCLFDECYNINDLKYVEIVKA